MDQFQAKFIEEANELIASLEGALLALEQSPNDPQLVEQIFRVMHTLKGNSSMFGFEHIGEITHHLESIYELVREGKTLVSTSILTVTLDSVDHLRALLNDPDLDDSSIVAAHQHLYGRIRQIMDQMQATNSAGSPEVIIDGDVPKKVVNTYLIAFRPHPDILSDGTNPLYLLDELSTLGTCKAIARTNAIPGLDAIQADQCYVHWDIFLATNQGEDAIRDVFIFVSDACQIHITCLASENLFEQADFLSRIEEASTQLQDIKPEEFLSANKPKFDELAKKVAALKTITADKTTAKTGGETREQLSSSIRVSSDKLDSLMNLISELVITQARLSLFSEGQVSAELLAITEDVEKISRRLRDNAFSICLVPLESIVIRFQRLVRDLSAELGKEAILITEGTDTELDKTIIENITDPLLHILRNCMDHGIEDAATRIKLEKPVQSKILLKAFYSGTHVHIQVKDDGAGMDPQKIRAKAVQKGIIAPDAVLTDKELINLIFLPGFSTAAAITDVSGRGVGMDVVRRKISDIRGEVELQSQVGVGTIITIKLPLTLSIIDGLLVKISDTHYVIPLSAVDKCYEVAHSQIAHTFNNLVVLDGEQIPFFYLREEFAIHDNPPPIEQLVLIHYEDHRIGLVVDSIIGEYQAVVKPLGKLYKNQEVISGATILGDGTIALIMDTTRAIREFCQRGQSHLSASTVA